MPANPTAVFTPAGALPPGMFATRAQDALEQKMVDALNETGRQVAVHGWTGVGKTSLVEHVCGAAGIEYVPAECSGSFEDLMHSALSYLDAHSATEVVEVTRRSAEGGGGALGLFSAKAGGERSKEKRYAKYSGPLESLVVDALSEAGVRVLFIDNLEDLDDSDSERRGICRLMKLCSGRTRELGPLAPKVVVAGPTDLIDQMLLLDAAASRRATQIEVPRMSPSEVEQILVRGQEKLDLVFDDQCREQIVAHADGFPYYAHLYALHCSRLAIRASRSTITAGDFYAALDQILDACAGTLKEAYGRATRQRGDPKLRRGAMAAIAVNERIEVSLEDARQAFLELHPQYGEVERVQFIGALLKEFRDEFGILDDAWSDDGGRAYRFHDPLMRVYVRLRTLRDRRDTAAAWRSFLPLPEAG